MKKCDVPERRGASGFALLVLWLLTLVAFCAFASAIGLGLVHYPWWVFAVAWCAFLLVVRVLRGGK